MSSARRALHTLLFLVLGAGFAARASAQCPGCTGDLNTDGRRDGADISLIVECLLTGMSPLADCACGDANTDGTLDAADAALLAALLVNSDGSCSQGQLTIQVDSSLIGVTQSIDALVQLSVAAPSGGLVIQLSSDASGVAEFLPAQLMIAEGESSALAHVVGISAGTATLTAAAAGYVPGQISVQVTPAYISLASNLRLVPGQSRELALSLSLPAPAGGATITLSNSNTNVALVDAVAFVPAGSRTPVNNPVLQAVGLGTTQIQATAPGYASANRLVSVASNALTASPASLLLANGGTELLTIHAAVAAPSGGLLISLLSMDSSIATVPASVAIPEGQNSVGVPVTAVAPGQCFIRINRAGDAPIYARVLVIADTPVRLGYSNVIVGNNLQWESYPGTGYIIPPAPPGGVTITITSSDPDKVRLSNSAGAAGASSIELSVLAGTSFLPPYYVQGLAAEGHVTLTAVATGGYGATSAGVELAPSSFYFTTPGIVTTDRSLNTLFGVESGAMNAFGYLIAREALRGGHNPVIVPLDTADHAVGIVDPPFVTFDPGDSSAYTEFDPAQAGVTSILLAAPAGFAAGVPNQITATVTHPHIYVSDMLLGQNLQSNVYSSLEAPAPAGNLLLHVHSNDPSRVRLALDDQTPGTADIDIFVPAGTGTSPFPQVPYFYIQGHDDNGTVLLELSATGYEPATMQVTLLPSGFRLYSPYTTVAHAGGPDIVLYASPGVLSLTHNWIDLYQPVRPGLGTVLLDIENSNPAVGTVVTTPLTFTAGSQTVTGAFHPDDVNTGGTILHAVAPPGFVEPVGWSELQITVDPPIPPNIYISGDFVGRHMQISGYGYLESPAPPPNGLDVTLTSSNPSRLLLSDDPAAAGSGQIVLHVPPGQIWLPPFVLQSLDNSGTETLTASAPGYAAGMATIQLVQSGFMFDAIGENYQTTTFSPDTQFNVQCVAFPTPQVYSRQSLRGGMSPVVIDLTSTDETVGTLAASPVTMNPGQSYIVNSFHPLTAGQTSLRFGPSPDFYPPSGFDVPPNYAGVNVTVTAPTISMPDVIVGRHLAVAVDVYLQTGPPNPVTVTLASTDPSVVRISPAADADGSASLDVAVAANETNVGRFFVQGISIPPPGPSGSATITLSAPGYAPGAAGITVVPSGFLVTSGNIATTTHSADQPIYVCPCALNAQTLVGLNQYHSGYDCQPLRGGLGPVAVPISNDSPAVGNVTVSPVVFQSGDLTQLTAFDPTNVGTSTISVATPPGFDTPSDLPAVADVRQPNIQLSLPAVGRDLQIQSNLFVYLEVPPPDGAPVNVTLTATPGYNGGIVTLTDDPTQVGSDVLLFNNVTTNTPGLLVIQGRTLGAATLTVSAPGYTTAVADIEVAPAGFAFTYSYEYASLSGGPRSIAILPYALDTMFLNPINTAQQFVRAGLPPAVLIIGNSNPTAGNVSPGMVTFQPGDGVAGVDFLPSGPIGATTQLSLPVPSGFTQPSSLQLMTVEITP